MCENASTKYITYLLVMDYLSHFFFFLSLQFLQHYTEKNYIPITAVVATFVFLVSMLLCSLPIGSNVNNVKYPVLQI